MQHLDEGVLHELLDGEIPSSDLPPIQAHLAACPECRARLEEAREFAGTADELIETIELPAAPPARRAVQPRPAPRRWGRDLAWAATVVVAVGAGYLARGGSRPAVVALSDTAAPTTIANQASVPPAELERSAEVPDDRRAAASGAAAPRQQAADRPAPPASPRREAAPGPADLTANESKDRDTLPKTKVVETLALEQIVITGAADKAALVGGLRGRVAGAPAPTTPPAAAAASRAGMKMETAPAANELRLDEAGKVAFAKKQEGTPVEITLTEALKRLNGTIRLIEGLVTLRLEAMDTVVRVVYPLSPGELVLEQWLVDRRVSYRLLAPANFPADSLERLRARVRD